MVISVIIPAYNEEDYIRAAIDSIKGQTLPHGYKSEIVVVDNGSTDRTMEMANETIREQDRVLKYSDIRNAGAARNCGARNTDGKILVFLDADSTLSSNALYNASRFIEQGYIGGRCVIKPPEDGIIPRMQTWILNTWGRYIGPQYTPYMFMTREAFERVNGWPKEPFLGEEIIMQRGLSEIGNFAFDTDSFVNTSPRRYQEQGYVRVTILGILAYFGLIKKEWKPEDRM